MIKLASWDLEIATNTSLKLAFAEGKDKRINIWDYYPFGISVGALKLSDDPNAEVVLSSHGGCPRQEMTVEDVTAFVTKLFKLQQDGYKVFTWNGAGFDWRLLAKITGEHRLCVDLCKQSYDPMFQVLCTLGYPIGLNSVSKTFGLQAKEMSGADAPAQWEAGNFDAVIEYVIGDVKRLEGIIIEIIKQGGVKWTTRKGALKFQPMKKFLTVAECLRLPEPDTSWMDNPLTREEVTSWWQED